MPCHAASGKSCRYPYVHSKDLNDGVEGRSKSDCWECIPDNDIGHSATELCGTIYPLLPHIDFSVDHLFLPMFGIFWWLQGLCVVPPIWQRPWLEGLIPQNDWHISYNQVGCGSRTEHQVLRLAFLYDIQLQKSNFCSRRTHLIRWLVVFVELITHCRAEWSVMTVKSLGSR